jgi:hypothetical protein
MQGVDGDWRWMVGIPIVPAVALAFATAALPESPKWLIMVGDLPSALRALHRLRCSQVCRNFVIWCPGGCCVMVRILIHSSGEKTEDTVLCNVVLL